ncbi:hypothetical protein FI667_g14383, partial [Globisporangium splendens]
MGDRSALVCPICLDTLATPVVLATCCGQSFCRVCLDAALAKVDACPMCREPLLRGGKHAVTRNRVLEEIVARLPPSMCNSGNDDTISTTREADGDDKEHHVLIQILQDAATNDAESDPRELGSLSQDDSRVARLQRQLRHVLQSCTAALRWRRLRRGYCGWQSVSCRQWRHWCQIHWASLQCVFYVVLFFVFVSFLRVQEEEFAAHQTRH